MQAVSRADVEVQRYSPDRSGFLLRMRHPVHLPRIPGAGIGQFRLLSQSPAKVLHRSLPLGSGSPEAPSQIVSGVALILYSSFSILLQCYTPPALEGEELVYASLPSRKATTRWRIAGHRTIALMDGVRLFLALALIVDSVRSFF